MTEARPSATSEFRRVAQLLRDGIGDGTYPRGERLPAAAVLAGDLGTNRGTVERAVRTVAAEGLLTTRKGSGAFVSRILERITRRSGALLDKQSGGEADGTREAVDAELRTMGLVARRFPSVRTERPPQDVALLLGRKQSAKQALACETRVYAAAAEAPPADPGTPVELICTYLPLDIAGGTALEHHDPGPMGVRGRLAKLGHRPTEFVETVLVRAPSDEEAEFLGIDVDNRVIHLTQTAWAGGRVVAVTVTVLPASLWSLSYQWTAGA
ncbi:GntR family transcriptional regulator [Streptomyces subrutilus]|uniref:HTH gntR-type domain-containing protein n=1 Tax=Streptomyces subrutilus TaxID=36818 RepID=A0A1E5NXE2_9ACTN|nr:GntR family transcriptional regulator [Streptomyces subrutilus]OEJ20895.1 hypothetical protein BGK67_35255 [Streptomyces subrutilus]